MGASEDLPFWAGSHRPALSVRTHNLPKNDVHHAILPSVGLDGHHETVRGRAVGIDKGNEVRALRIGHEVPIIVEVHVGRRKKGPLVGKIHEAAATLGIDNS